jgi:hypothetical protein
VHGHRAFWARGGLVWQYARGGWALLYLPYPFDLSPKVAERVKPGASLAAAERDAVKLASRVAFDAVTPPLKFPVQLTGLPGRWQLSGATYVPDGSVLRARTFALNAGPGAGVRDYDGGLTFQNNLPWFEIDPVSAQHNPCVAARTSVREVINGYHVIVTHRPGERTVFGNVADRLPPNQSLCAANADGLALYISEYVPRLVLSVESLFSDHLRLLGTDPAHWTNQPVR